MIFFTLKNPTFCVSRWEGFMIHEDGIPILWRIARVRNYREPPPKISTFEFGGFFWVAQKHDTSFVVEPRKVPKVLFWGGGENSTPYQHPAEKVYWILLQSAISKCKQLCMEFLFWPICIVWKGNSFLKESNGSTPQRFQHMAGFQVETKPCPVFDSSR